MISSALKYLFAIDLGVETYGNNRLILKNIHFFSLSFILLFVLTGGMYFSMHMWSEGAFYSFLALFNLAVLILIRTPHYKNIGMYINLFINLLFMFLGKVMGDESIIQLFLITAVISTYYYTVSKSSRGKLFAFLLVVTAYLIIETLIDEEHLSFFADIKLKGFIGFLFIAFGILANLFVYNYLHSINWISPVKEGELLRAVSSEFNLDDLGEDDSCFPDDEPVDEWQEQEIVDDYTPKQELNEIVQSAEIHLVIDRNGEEKFVFLSDSIAELFGVDLDEAMKEPYVIWEKVVDQKRLLKNTFSQLPTKRCITTDFRVKKEDGSFRWLESIGIVNFEDEENLLHIHEMITEIKDPEKVKK